MSKYFGLDDAGEPFQLFSISHIAALSIIVAIGAVLYVLRNRLESERIRKCFRYTLAVLLLLQEMSLTVWYLLTDTWSVENSLPLHLCEASVILCAAMLFTKSYPIYEVVYFWGLGGALQALLTPDLWYDFPHYRFFQFFISHGLIIASVLFMTFMQHYRPTAKSIIRTFLITNFYALMIAFVNFFTGANYLFLCEKPESASLIDYLGPWPWYVLSLEFVAILLFTICYSPFALRDFPGKRGSRGIPTDFSA